MNTRISKSEKFVREHYPRSKKRLNFFLHNFCDDNVIWDFDKDGNRTKPLGKGMSNLEAWRDAARNIRNNIKHQP